MNGSPLPLKLSEESLEEIVIAITKARDERGLHVQLPLDQVLTPWVIQQLPQELQH